MTNFTGLIINSCDVELGGKFQLPLEQAISPQGQTGPGTVPAQANIVENHPEYALIEVTCSCGTKTYIKCEYADNQRPDVQTGQNEQTNGENQNET